MLIHNLSVNAKFSMCECDCLNNVRKLVFVPSVPKKSQTLGCVSRFIS